MKLRVKLRLLFVCLISVGSIHTISAENIYKKFTVEKCDSLINANTTNPNFVILDVRTYGEWINNHIESSINRSTRDADFQQQLDALPKHKIFLLHCQSGGRSAGAFTKMQSLEFAEVYEMKGGIGSWKSRGYPTTSELAPEIMLVSYTDSLEYSTGTDTINITITNRANETLTFSSATFNDLHVITNNFDNQKTLEGAEDYTFSIFHSPGYYEDDSTKIFIKSNGGELKISIVFKDGIIQNIKSEFQKNDLVMYPNPARNNLFIKSNSFLNIEEVSFINLNGQVVLRDNYFSINNGIDISDLKNGVYFVRIKTGEQFVSRKVVVKH